MTKTFRNILVGHDYCLCRIGIITLLKDQFPDKQFFEASDNETILKQIRKGSIDLAIINLEMEGGNGLQLIEQMRQAQSELPILVLGYDTDEMYALRVYKAGAYGYLTRHILPEDLIHAFDKIQLGKKYVTAEIAEKLLNEPNMRPPHEILSNREFDIFKMIASGKTLSQIARKFSLSKSTISTHRKHILTKFNVKTNAELIRYAITHHLVNHGSGETSGDT